MTSINRVEPPRQFWIVAIAALLWNGFGMWNFLSRLGMTGEDVFALPVIERQLYMMMPQWITIVTGIAVTAGVLGAISLLLRKPVAVVFFMASLIAVLVQMAHSLYLAGYLDLFAFKTMLIPAVTIAIAVYMLHYSKNAIYFRWLV